MASALHIHGIDHISRVLADLRYWLEKREYTSLGRDARLPEPPFRARYFALRPRQLHQDAELLQSAADDGRVLIPYILFYDRRLQQNAVAISFVSGRILQFTCRGSAARPFPGCLERGEERLRQAR